MVRDLTKGRPANVILLFAFPIILGNVFQQVYSVVDSIIVGRYVSYQALAGVGITNGLTFFIFGFVLGVTSGLGIMTAQFFGAKNYAKMRQSLGTGFIICAGLSVLLTIIAVASIKPSLKFMGASDDIYEYSHDYLAIIYIGLITQVAYNMVSCILRGLGDSKTPLYFLIFSSVLNIVLDYLFVKTFGWGVTGVAWATVVSQLVSAIFCFIYVFTRYKELRLKREDFRTSWSFIWDHLRVGLPMALQFSITAFGVIVLYSALNDFPTTYIAGFTTASKIQSLGMLVPISLGVAIANYVGQNYGAGNLVRMRVGVNSALLMSIGVCIIVSITMALLATPLTSMFLDPNVTGDRSAIYAASTQYLYVSALFFPFLFLLFIYRNALQGVGKTFMPLMAGVTELVVRVVASLILPKFWGYQGIILVDVLAWVGACLLLFISYRIQMPNWDRQAHQYHWKFHNV
ncbi:MAG: MATE family efflux transporter [Bacteroidales bacterium]|nr:MATE family efflux transporter [Bacteroidales bacterium]